MKPWKTIKSIWNNQSAKTRFWICLTLSGLIYVAFTLPFTLRRYYAIIPPVDYAKLTHYSVIGFIAYLAGIITLFSLYGLGLQVLIKEQKAQSKIGIIMLTGTLFALILSFSYPQTAIDLFVYAIRTRGWAMYDLLPFSSSPDAMPASDPW
ncbi:MAG: hypothetical protein U9Q82_12040, partial [Chloroflexota bacterium]|nr:hypothetical protein [Chloroflexota bacterium]